jgi:hypothetical protein
MRCAITAALAAVLFVAAPALADDYSLKITKVDPPKTVSDAIRKELGKECAEVQDASKDTLLRVWLVKQLPNVATAGQAKNGLTYKELKETGLIGVLEVVAKKGMTDYREQQIGAGVYTLRLGFMPASGDHEGKAPNPEFCLLSPVAKDTKPAALSDLKSLVELSNNSTDTGHPAVMLLVPVKPAKKLELTKHKSLDGHWVLNGKVETTVDKKSYEVGIGLVVVGKSSG